MTDVDQRRRRSDRQADITLGLIVAVCVTVAVLAVVAARSGWS